MHLNIPSERAARLTRPRIEARPEMLATAERNVQRARQFNSSKQPRAIAAAANESSFGEKLKKAVAARRGTPSATTRKEADEQAQKERSRYRKQRRERSKGE